MIGSLGGRGPYNLDAGASPAEWRLPVIPMSASPRATRSPTYQSGRRSYAQFVKAQALNQGCQYGHAGTTLEICNVLAFRRRA